VTATARLRFAQSLADSIAAFTALSARKAFLNSFRVDSGSKVPSALTVDPGGRDDVVGAREDIHENVRSSPGSLSNLSRR
jgi:hypothetical protein